MKSASNVKDPVVPVPGKTKVYIWNQIWIRAGRNVCHIVGSVDRHVIGCCKGDIYDGVLGHLLVRNERQCRRRDGWGRYDIHSNGRLVPACAIGHDVSERYRTAETPATRAEADIAAIRCFRGHRPPLWVC